MPSIQTYILIPFLLMLLSIALMPTMVEKFWDKNKNKFYVSVVLSIPVLIYLIANGLSSEIIHTMVYEYIPFILLLTALYIISGGIFILVSANPKPIVITGLLASAAIMASFIGTTGSAVLFIRPLLKLIHYRKFKQHTVLFFIAIAANTGGLLTPLGDPPLFLIYLKGAPFLWFMELFPEWLFVNTILIILYFIFDSYFFKKEPDNPSLFKKSKIRVKMEGELNLLFLLGVILSVLFLNESYFPDLMKNPVLRFSREIVLIVLCILSYYITSPKVHKKNHFSFHAMEETAIIFLGIFVTMIPCLLYLSQNARSLNITETFQYYYYTGMFSSFLDNTPTALVMHTVAKFTGITNPPLIAGITERFLAAICTASVFFGSMTYIGNGPNFLIKSIADHQHVKLPNFFGYMFKFSLVILLPIFILVQLIFF